MNRVTINDVELKRLQECYRIVEMIEVLCGEPFMSITFHSEDGSIPDHEHLITIMGSRPTQKPHRGENLEEYEAEHYGRSLAECLEQAVAAKKVRAE